VRTHLSVAMPAFGTTAKKLTILIDADKRFKNMEAWMNLTKMAQSYSNLVTNDDVLNHVKDVCMNLDTKIVIFNVALCDYTGTILPKADEPVVQSGKYAPRLKTSDGVQTMMLTPQEKILKHIRSNGRKDIFLVAFKTTSGASEKEQ
jgi:hypothetical protein